VTDTQTPTTQTAAPADAQAEAPKLTFEEVAADPIDAAEVPTENVPEQGGSFIPLLQPATYALRLPDEIAKCWGDPYLDKDQKPRLRIRFGNEQPLTVVGGAKDGDVLSTSWSTQPRPRGREKTPIADMFYFVRTSLMDATVPRTLGDWKAIVNAHAGQVFYAEVGVSANCNPKATRWVLSEDPENPGRDVVIEDPSGQKGCGESEYTRDLLKLRDENGDVPERITCKKCGASVRVFNQIDKFLPPAQG